MASQEGGTEPVAASSAGQTHRYRFRDIIVRRHDELDAFISENKKQPFLVVHRLKTAGKHFLIRGTPVICRMDSVEQNTDSGLVDEDTLYTFHVTHDKFEWTVKRKYKEFQELERDLQLRKMIFHLLPFERFRMSEEQSMLSKISNHDESVQTRRLSGIGTASCQDSKKDLEDYLNNVLEKVFCRNANSMMEFLDVSPLSFVSDLGPKGLEGLVIKRSGGHQTHALQCIGFNKCCFRWSQRWMAVKDSFLLFINRDEATINGVMLFDPEFKAELCSTDVEFGISIKNTARKVVIECSSDKQAEWWCQEINQLAESCDFFKVQRFGGFAPPRENTLTKWYVNGSDYFADLADALLKAKEEIFIADWWLSPKVFLKRPANDKDWRLDKILQEKAKDGVKIYILLYREVTYALSINSDYSKRTLRKKHGNIKVIRHPDRVSSGVILWAHHEKMVAIDQTVAFVGGIDLTFGRWDDDQYRLTDLGFEEELNGEAEKHHNKSCLCCQTAPSEDLEYKMADGPKPENQTKQGLRNQAGYTKLWPGKDYNNFILKDWTRPEKPFEENVDRTKVPRIPWRDLSAAVHGKAARDVARHFIQRWNVSKMSKMKYRVDSYPYLVPKSHSTANSLPFTVRDSKKAQVQVLRSAGRWSTTKLETSIHEAYIDTIKKSKHYIYIENQFFISCADETTIHNGICDAVVERILRAHREHKKFRVFVVIPLLPGFEGDIRTGGGKAIQAILHYTYRTINRGKVSILSQLSEEIDNWKEYITFCGLRTHSKLSGSLVTELIYVHSKVLIADDRCYIIGSANINDRSMLGKRDSELAVLVEDEERVLSIMGGQEYEAGPLTLALRKECFSVLLGANSEPSINIDDPISDDFFGIWNKTAEFNTKIYEKVFKCLPSDTVHSMQQLKEYNNQTPTCDPEQAEEELKAIRGFLVHFPLKFLGEENLLPPPTSKEGMAPSTLWT